VPNAALRFQPTAEQLTALGVTGDTAAVLSGGKGVKTSAVWRQVGATLERLIVQAGITDGTTTAVVGPLEPGDQLVTALGTGATVTAKATQSSSGAVRNPLMGGGMPGPPPGR
jgi:hypothetical protein